MRKDDKIIIETLKMLKEQTGLELQLCPDFPGLKKKFGKKGFNVLLKKPIFDSDEYELLLRFANKYKTIELSPNGSNRVLIIVKKI